MKITLDLTSIVVGGAVALALGVVAGFSPQATSVPAAANAAPRQITGQFSPHPGDFVWLEGENNTASALLTVPAGKILVITGFAAASGTPPDARVYFQVDGNTRFVLASLLNLQGNGKVQLTLQAGQTLKILPDEGLDWIFGYWADA